MTRILVADDHPIILSGLRAILSGTDYTIVAEAADGEEALAAMASASPEILVLDVRMPKPDGIDLLIQLRQRMDKRPVVLLTADLSDDQLIKAVELGVEGILLKETAQDQMIACLDQIRQGRRWIEPALVQRALDLKLREGRDKGTGLAALSRRELAIARLVALGMRNREIATELGITEGTVKVYLHRIYEKVSVGNRTELAILVRDAG